MNLLDRIGGAMFATWPLSTIGFYGTGATLFPGSVETVVYVAARVVLRLAVGLVAVSGVGGLGQRAVPPVVGKGSR